MERHFLHHWSNSPTFVNFMKWYCRAAAAVIITFCFQGLNAQYGSNAGTEYMVSGSVADSAVGTPVLNAKVSLLNIQKAEIMATTVPDTAGYYFFLVKSAGEYAVVIEAEGYKNITTATFNLNDSQKTAYLNKVLLPSAALRLGPAEIKVEKPLIENNADKLIYNASQDISSKGGSATDLLRKVPMVEVDMDGNVSIRGSQNVRVLINGKPSGIVSAGVKDALRTIPSDEIERVEVITNPSAKYDAEGTAGIINIVLKDSRLKGTSGNIHSGFGNRSGNLGLGISKQYKKTGLSFRMGGFYWRNVGEQLTERRNTIDSIEYLLVQNNNNRVFGTGPRVSLGVDHAFNKFHSLSVAATVRGNGTLTQNDWITETGSSVQPLSLQYGRNTRNINYTMGYDLTADYRRTFKKEGREWNMSVMYNGNSQNTEYTANQTDKYSIENYREKSNNVGLNNEFSFQTDLVEPLNKKLTLESGIKGIMRNVTSSYDMDSFSFVNNEYTVITAMSNEFFYHQNVLGGYSQLSWKLNPKYSIRFGGRYEFTSYGGGRQDSSLEFTGQPYGNLIPFFNVNRVFGYTGFIRFNYTQRLLRPSLFYLNPYTNFSDPRNLTTGNPYLRAEVANNIELSGGNYTKKGGGSITAYYRRTNNSIESIRTVDTLGVYRTTYGNVGLNYTTGFDLNMNLKGTDWMVNFNGGLGYVNIKSLQNTGAVANASNSGIVYSAGLWGFYKFTKQWSVESFMRVNAPTFSLQGRTQNWYFHTIGVKRRFKNDAGGIGIGVDNPFTPHVTYITDQSGIDFSYHDVREINMLGIRVNFDYKFGKVEVEQNNKPKKGIKNDDLKPGGNDQGGQSGS